MTLNKIIENIKDIYMPYKRKGALHGDSFYQREWNPVAIIGTIGVMGALVIGCAKYNRNERAKLYETGRTNSTLETSVSDQKLGE